MKFKTIDDLDLKGKRVLLRVDLNSDVHKGKVIEAEDRFKAHSETIKFLKKKKAKVIVLAHQGKPGKRDCRSLKKHSEFLKKYVSINFVSETIGNKVWKEISSMNDGDALLLENVRFLKEEFEPSVRNNFVNFMKEAGIDYYVNDAFSISHRNQTSITSMAKAFDSYAGPVLKEEYDNISRIKSKLNNCVFVLGGEKSEDLISLMDNKRVLSAGKLSLIALKSKGFPIRKSNGLSDKEFKLASRIKKYLKNIELPVDLAFKHKGRKEIYLEDLPFDAPVLDIGKQTALNYSRKIKSLEPNDAVFVKGAAGMFEEKDFEKGTKEILKSVSKSRAFSVVAGGSSSDAVRKFKIPKKKFNYISLSGGALVHFLAGEKLPGLEALKK